MEKSDLELEVCNFGSSFSSSSSASEPSLSSISSSLTTSVASITLFPCRNLDLPAFENNVELCCKVADFSSSFLLVLDCTVSELLNEAGGWYFDLLLDD